MSGLLWGGLGFLVFGIIVVIIAIILWATDVFNSTWGLVIGFIGFLIAVIGIVLLILSSRKKKKAKSEKVELVKEEMPRQKAVIQPSGSYSTKTAKVE